MVPFPLQMSLSLFLRICIIFATRKSLFFEYSPSILLPSRKRFPSDSLPVKREAESKVEIEVESGTGREGGRITQRSVRISPNFRGQIMRCSNCECECELCSEIDPLTHPRWIYQQSRTSLQVSKGPFPPLFCITTRDACGMSPLSSIHWKCCVLPLTKIQLCRLSMCLPSARVRNLAICQHGKLHIVTLG